MVGLVVFSLARAQGKISLPVVLFPHLLLSRLSLSLLGGDDADLWPGMKKDPPDGTRAGRWLEDGV